jgi:hypothetical protein
MVYLMILPITLDYKHIYIHKTLNGRIIGVNKELERLHKEGAVA